MYRAIDPESQVDRFPLFPHDSYICRNLRPAVDSAAHSSRARAPYFQKTVYTDVSLLVTFQQHRDKNRFVLVPLPKPTCVRGQFVLELYHTPFAAVDEPYRPCDPAGPLRRVGMAMVSANARGGDGDDIQITSSNSLRLWPCLYCRVHVHHSTTLAILTFHGKRRITHSN